MADVVAGAEQHVAAPDLATLGVRFEQRPIIGVKGFEQQVAVEGVGSVVVHGGGRGAAVKLSSSGLLGAKMSNT